MADKLEDESISVFRRRRPLGIPLRGLWFWIRHIAVSSLVIFISLFEVPTFLLRNRSIFRNNLCYVSWHWSFGHNISGIDCASRLFAGNRISLIYIPHPRSNDYLPYCFEHNMDPFIYRGAILFQHRNIDKWRYFVLRMFLLIVSIIRSDFQVLGRELVYRAVFLAQPGAPAATSERDIRESAHILDLTGYLRLLNDGIGEAPKLPYEFENRCREAIEGRHPGFFDRPLVVLLLRRRSKDSNTYETRIRDAGPDENYVPAVRFLTERGYRVVGQGGINHDIFREIDGYYALDDLDVPAALLNLYLLTTCRLYLGQHSGAYMLPNSCGNRTCLIDTGAFVDGTFMREDIILFKRAFDTSTGRWLSPIEIFRNHMDLALAYSFESEGIRLEPNSPDEILGAVRETIESIEATLTLSSADKRLCKAFRSIVPPTTLLYYKGNRTSLEILRRDQKYLRDV